MKKLIAIIALTALLILPVQSVIASSTLWQHYTEKGQNLPSISSRAVLYENIAKDLYRGTAKQNIALLAYLEGGSNNNFDLNSIFTSFGLPNYGDNTLVGGNVPNTATGWHLSIPHASSDTTITLEDFDDLRGNSVTDFPTKIYLVVEPENTNNTEIVMCPLASISTTSYYFASCTRGLAFSGTSEASVTANKKAHPAGARVIMTNVGQFFNNFVDIDSAQSIGGVKTFTSIPKAPTSTPTNDQELITLYQFQQATSTGGIIGSESVKGVWEGATQNEMGGGVATGTSGAYLVPQSQYMGTSSSARIMIPVTEADGDINAGFIGQDQNYTWSGTNSWSSTSTFSGPIVGLGLVPFGSGADGDVTITSGTTTLARDMYYNNLTVNAGTAINSNGFRIFIKNNLTVTSTGVIYSNGGAGGIGGTATGNGSSPGAGGSAGAVAYSAGSLPIPLAGVVGTAGSTAADATTGTIGISATKSIVNSSGVAGGKGGDYTYSGGATSTPGSVSGTIYSYPYGFTSAYNLFDISGTATTQFRISPGSGGGSGGSKGIDCSGAGGGGSGSTGGMVWISARNIIRLNAESIGGKGGNGGTIGGACGSPYRAGTGGGGGGGNGGSIIIIYSTETSIVTNVSGGIGGTLGVATSEMTPGNNGVNGNSGLVIKIQL